MYQLFRKHWQKLTQRGSFYQMEHLLWVAKQLQLCYTPNDYPTESVSKSYFPATQILILFKEECDVLPCGELLLFSSRKCSYLSAKRVQSRRVNLKSIKACVDLFYICWGWLWWANPACVFICMIGHEWRARLLMDLSYSNRPILCGATTQGQVWFDGSVIFKIHTNDKKTLVSLHCRLQNIARNSSRGLGHTQSAIWVWFTFNDLELSPITNYVKPSIW